MWPPSDAPFFTLHLGFLINSKHPPPFYDIEPCTFAAETYSRKRDSWETGKCNGLILYLPIYTSPEEIG
jgi:hypothetical protein